MQLLNRFVRPVSVFLLFTVPAVIPASVGAQSTLPLDIERVGERVLVMAPKTGNSRVVVLNARDGLVMLDSGFSPDMALRLRAEAERVFNRSDWHSVILSGEEFLSSGGSSAFSGAEIIAHRDVREYLESNRDALPDLLADRCDEFQWRVDTTRARLDTMARPPEGLVNWLQLCEAVAADLAAGFTIPLPTLSFDDRITLDLGDLTVECIYFGDAASWGDVMVRVPEENLIWTGDVFHAMHVLPYADNPDRGCDIDRWLSGLEELLSGDPAATRAFRANGTGEWSWWTVNDRRRLMQDIGRIVREAKASGSNLEALLERVDDVETVFPYAAEWEGVDLDLVRSDIRRTTEGVWYSILPG
jgi:glyoxylase-like metal-dependent hydrolase (beta-lactamase superfamily II)